MNADGVDVLHAADGDGMVGGIAHDLKLDLLVALDTLLHMIRSTAWKKPSITTLTRS